MGRQKIISAAKTKTTTASTTTEGGGIRVTISLAHNSSFLFRFPLIDGFRLRVTDKGHEFRQEYACHVPNDR
jgi:hypothetical protein